MQIVYERVAAIDVGKKEVAVTVRTPGDGPGQRRQQTRKFRTFYGEPCVFRTGSIIPFMLLLVD